MWDKTERIKRNTLIGDITKGGLNIVDVDCKLKALKAAWIPRLLKSKGILFNMINSYCNKLKIDINFLLQCSTTNPENLKNIKLPLFYREIISCFNESKSELDYEKISSQNLLLQPIWNNSKLLYKGNPIFFDNWVKSGILYIADLFDRNGCFKPLDEFMIIKDKSNWLCEYKILLLATKSIRKINFSKNASHSNKPNATHFYFPLGYSNIHEKPSKFFYLNLVEKKFCKPSFQTKLADELDIHEGAIWKNIYRCKIKDIKDKHVAEFNYKLLNNILYYICLCK